MNRIERIQSLLKRVNHRVSVEQLSELDVEIPSGKERALIAVEVPNNDKSKPTKVIRETNFPERLAQRGLGWIPISNIELDKRTKIQIVAVAATIGITALAIGIKRHQKHK